MSSTLKTAIGVKNEQGITITHDITTIVGEFSPTLMCYLTGVREVYITKAQSIDPMNLVECLPFLQSMYCLIIYNCTQFHESHVLRAVENNKLLKYLDVSKSTKLSFEAAHYILGTLKDLWYFAFDPKYPELVNEWRHLLRTFRYRDVKFGGEICKVLDEE